MPPINSTAIRFVEYRAQSQELDITFESGGTYTYFDVPDSLYKAFLSAPSKGQFFHKNIRDKFRSSK